jgi:hypothetical protein
MRVEVGSGTVGRWFESALLQSRPNNNDVSLACLGKFVETKAG